MDAVIFTIVISLMLVGLQFVKWRVVRIIGTVIFCGLICLSVQIGVPHRYYYGELKDWHLMEKEKTVSQFSRSLPVIFENLDHALDVRDIEVARGNIKHIREEWDRYDHVQLKSSAMLLLHLNPARTKESRQQSSPADAGQ